MKYLCPAWLFLPFLLLSCQSPEAQSLGAGVATAGALVVAVPLAPAAGAYHLLSGTGARERKSERVRGAQQEPLWQQRCRDLAARSPQRDARRAFSSGKMAFLTFRPEIAEVRIGNAGYRMKNPAQNADIIRSSPLLRQLMELTSAYSVAQSGDLAWTEEFKRYVHASGDYREAFNAEMYRLIKKSRPDHPLLPHPLTMH
ncbi:MAG TPA: hypothetical protein VGE29_13335 [Prosthecobacter sp.]